MKKMTAFALAAVLVLGLFAGCTDDPGASVTSGQTEQSTSSASKKTDASEQTQQDSAGESTQSSEEASAEASQTEEGGFDYDAVDDYMTTIDGVYSIAYVTDGGAMRDGARNQNAWEGVKRYASENGKSYKCYQTYGRKETSDDDRYDAMKEAIRGGAELVVCAGPEQEQALRRIAQENPEVSFVFLEGFPLKDLSGNPMTNVLPVTFREEQLGYLAGYAAVREGMTHLGFLGAETGNSSRIGYGFLQGADAAAGEMETTVDVNYHMEKRQKDTPELRKLLEDWFADEIQLVFASGAVMQRCAAEVAADGRGTVISSEMEPENSKFLLCVTRNLRDAAWDACDAFYNGSWEELSGGMELGAEDDAVGLMTQTWNLKQLSVEDYSALLAQLKDGTVAVGAAPENGLSSDSFENLTLNIG